jgi:hypothetical protein
MPSQMRRGIGACVLGLAVAALAAAPAAQASFHLIKVREVYAGSAEDSYVELQMYASGQNFLTNHAMTVYNSSGALVHSSKFTSGVTNGQNQATVLIGDSNVQAEFGAVPDLVDPELSIPAAGGAACWNAGGLPADCVAWGNFSGGTALQMTAKTTVGSPASSTGITAAKAIRRTIAPGCSTLLEDSDDSNDSATDFAEVTPAPRNNASAITEKTCPGPPNTVIDEKPPAVTEETSALFTYEAPTATSYECKLDTAVFASCPVSGIEYSGLASGTHTFQVRGVNLAGPDPSPASYTWLVEGPSPVTPPSTLAPAATLEASPLVDSSSNSGSSSGSTVQLLFAKKPLAKTKDRTPTFRFRSEPAGASLECALDRRPFRSCRSPFTAKKPLAYGLHRFQVRVVGTSTVLRVRFRVVRGR